MKYLVDANVLSEVTRPQASANVIRWLRDHEADFVVNPIVLGEIEYGIGLTPSTRKRAELQKWLANGLSRLRIVNIDLDTASIWAALLVRLRKKGKTMPIKDSLIAASAIQHKLTIVTRNTTDFLHTGTKLIDPFKT
ncbi:MAG TPA: type II toxin-antitoxin system VapC family toxin [Planctomycetaceae bacterium]|nr:type II toxin-antitoxin system VapC family toxin [Planctomycetaceae bacterium]HQZ67664.1 type II toxin-antitoxin system VapC family toxin [Planctomycetaceae bacterium]